MRKNVKMQNKRRIIQEKRNFMLLKDNIRPWSHLTLSILKAKDFRQRMVIERQFTVFKSLFGYAQEQKYYRGLIEKGLQNYGIRLQSLAVKHLLKNIEN